MGTSVLELFNYIGEDNLQTQDLLRDLREVKVMSKKKCGRITFDTDTEMAERIMNEQDIVPFVVWAPREKLQELIDSKKDKT